MTRVARKLYTLEFGADAAPTTLARELHEWIIGDLFAFHQAAPRVVFLGGETPLEIGGPAGATIKKNALSLTPLEAIFTDKELYREGRDTVRIVVFAPSRKGDKVRASLRLNGDPIAELALALGPSGLGIFECPEPVAGAYSVMLAEASAEFLVAEYKLAPFTARLEDTSLATEGTKEKLTVNAAAESYGVPFNGRISLRLMDGSSMPPRVAEKAEAIAEAGRFRATFTLSGTGPFSIELQAIDDANKTATLPISGSRAEERSALELDAWGRRTQLRLMPFEGATEVRGCYLEQSPHPTGVSPFTIVSVDAEKIVLRLEAKMSAHRIVAIDPETLVIREYGSDVEAAAGTRVEIPHSGALTILFAGGAYFGHAFEGRASVLRPTRGAIEVTAPLRIEPGANAQLDVRGPPRSTALVIVKDERLQVTDTPLSATAAGLRRQAEAARKLGSDQHVSATIASLFPQPAPMALEMAFGAAMPRGMPVPAMAVRASGAVRQKSGGIPPPAPAAPARASAEGSAKGGAPTSAARSEFPEVILVKLATLDESGAARVDFRAGQAIGSISAEVFCVDGLDWYAVKRSILVSKELFGELVLPRFVRRGDYAEGRLYVSISEGRARVTVKRDGAQVELMSSGLEGPELDLPAPGATISFPAEAGEHTAEVRGDQATDRAIARVEEPGKLVWLQKAIRMLSPGERVELLGPNELALVILPSVDGALDKMVGGLMRYEHACCEQTSAVLLAAAAAYLTAPDPEKRQAASNHIRACVAREKSMHLPGRGFKGWPNYPDEVFVYSPGATLNLLQVELLRAHPLDAELAKAVESCLEMAKDAARAHGIDPAPAAPKSAREAYGRFQKFAVDRERMAAFIRERIEPWENQMKAILKFQLPGFTTETYRSSPAMIRAETAFGAAALIELGGVAQRQGLELANTVLGAIRENGAMYSTLDSVAAMTLLTALRNARIGLGGSAKVRVDGEELTLAEATERKSPRTIEAIDAPVQVQLTRLVEEDYTAINHGVVAKVWLERQGRTVTGRLGPGDAVDLIVELDRYEAGDLLHVFLPDALTWVMGGGQVKKFSLDFRGQRRILVPLSVTGVTLDAKHEVAPQHFAVCVRNMYDEKRGKGFGDLSVTVDPTRSGPDGIADKMLRGLRALLGT
ncbi:MAG: hypothetical protein HYV07_22485 [Deltaproteobacteria bacterium]|nr:hypothetical protein [Deltaproteobacteria bacterium]